MADDNAIWDFYDLQIVTITDMLGTIPKDRNVYENHVMDQAKTEMEKARAAEDAEHVPAMDVETRGWTGFYEDEEGRPILMNYQFKGFLKNAANVLKKSLGLTNARSHMNDECFVYPRQQIICEKVEAIFERPLRAMTAQGPRVSVMRSDVILAGKELNFTLKLLKESTIKEKHLLEILDYGTEQGLLQWRNAGYGAFTVNYLTKK